jgi:KDO2-lipid IV(A) lauroyltransferase
MSVKQYERWASRQGLLLIFRLSSIIPLKWIRLLSNIMGELAFIIIFKHRRLTIKNLQLVYGKEKTRQEIVSMAREVYRLGVYCICQFLFYYTQGRMQDLLKLVKVEGEENLKEAYAHGHGVIVLGAHMGNFLLIGCKLSAMGYQNATIMRQMKDEKVERLFQKWRDEVGVKSISKLPLTKAIKECLLWLKKGNILAMYIDQRSSQGIKVNFLGVPTLTATGAAVFALKTNASALPIIMLSTGKGYYKMVVGKCIDIERTGDLEKDIFVNTTKFTKVIEEYIRQYPTQWFWLHNRWKGMV